MGELSPSSLVKLVSQARTGSHDISDPKEKVHFFSDPRISKPLVAVNISKDGEPAWREVYNGDGASFSVRD